LFVLQAVESQAMTSLYDLLGARADDDEQAIKKAFRSAVKAHHPDLHPDDPDAVLRFRRIITASAILRDAKQRAAYDQILELERQQIKLRLDNQLLQLQYERRKTWQRRIRATAAIAVLGGLICGYGLFSPMPTTAIVSVMKDTPAAGSVPAARTATIVETIKKSKVATYAPTASGSAKAPVEEKVEPAETLETSGAQVIAHADGAVAGLVEDASRPSPAPVATDAADKGEGAVVADRGEPVPAAVLAVPRDARFYRELGTAAYHIGDFPRAIVNLDEAIRLDPNDARAYNIRGNAWDEIGAFDSALADYDAAIGIDPNNPIFFHDRAVLWHRNGNLDKAIIDLDRAIRFSFSDPNIYCDRGLVWYEKGSRARAVADFNNAMKLDPNFAAACISRGLIMHRDSEFTVALVDLGKTIHVSPSVFNVSRKLK
jgi:tetratricopeptide (TPR) repeat protein